MTVTLKIADGDIPVSSATGRFFEVENKDKLSQDTRENLDSEQQDNGTGADLDGVIGLIGDVFSIRAEISRRATDSFAALRRVQDSTQKFDRTATERFGRLAQVLVVPLRDASSGTIALTTFAYRVDILSAQGGAPVTVTGILAR